MIVSESKAKDYPKVPQGTHAARCISVIDIGTIPQTNPSYKESRQIIIMFELSNTKQEGGDFAGKPFMIGKFYKAYLGTDKKPSVLRSDLESWRGKTFSPDELKGFELKKLLNAGCMLSVIYEKDKPKINAIMSVPHGMEVPELSSSPFEFTLDDFNKEVFDNLTDGIKGLIMQSHEYKMITSV